MYGCFCLESHTTPTHKSVAENLQGAVSLELLDLFLYMRESLPESVRNTKQSCSSSSLSNFLPMPSTKRLIQPGLGIVREPLRVSNHHNLKQGKSQNGSWFSCSIGRLCNRAFAALWAEAALMALVLLEAPCLTGLGVCVAEGNRTHVWTYVAFYNRPQSIVSTQIGSKQITIFVLKFKVSRNFATSPHSLCKAVYAGCWYPKLLLAMNLVGSAQSPPARPTHRAGHHVPGRAQDVS